MTLWMCYLQIIIYLFSLLHVHSRTYTEILRTSRGKLNIKILQHAKKVVSDSPGLVDFVIGLVNFVLYLPNWQVKFFEEFKLQKTYYCEINCAHQKVSGAS